LLVLDNCEHLVEACAVLVRGLTEACAHLHVLATSREALKIPAERVWHVRPLAVPSQTESETVARLADLDVPRQVGVAEAPQPAVAMNVPEQVLDDDLVSLLGSASTSVQ
jgi:predicted ATPase